METWTFSDAEKTGTYLGAVEFQSDDGEFHHFEIIETETRLVFGGICNIGFMESGYMKFDHDFSVDENLQQLIEDLEVYYNAGAEYVSNIVCTERM